MRCAPTTSCSAIIAATTTISPRAGSIYELAAELYGRADGCSGGRGGSVHLTAPDDGLIATSAILGETTAVAVGAALAFQMDGATAWP